MFRPRSMRQVEILLLRRDLAASLRALAAARIIHLYRLEAGTAEKQEVLAEEEDLLARYREFVGRVDRLLEGTAGEPAAGRILEPLDFPAWAAWAADLQAQLGGLRDRQRQLQRCRLRLVAIGLFLRRLGPVEGAFATLANLRLSCLRLGLLPTTALAELATLPGGCRVYSAGPAGEPEPDRRARPAPAGATPGTVVEQPRFLSGSPCSGGCRERWPRSPAGFTGCGRACTVAGDNCTARSRPCCRSTRPCCGTAATRWRWKCSFWSSSGNSVTPGGPSPSAAGSRAPLQGIAKPPAADLSRPLPGPGDRRPGGRDPGADFQPPAAAALSENPGGLRRPHLSGDRADPASGLWLHAAVRDDVRRSRPRAGAGSGRARRPPLEPLAGRGADHERGRLLCRPVRCPVRECFRLGRTLPSPVVFSPGKYPVVDGRRSRRRRGTDDRRDGAAGGQRPAPGSGNARC